MIARYAVDKLVPVGETITVSDVIRNSAYSDANIIVAPKDKLTGSIIFGIGSFENKKTVAYANELKLTTWVAGTSDFDATMFPPTQNTEPEKVYGPHGEDMVLNVTIHNTGSVDVLITVHFLVRLANTEWW